MGPFSLTSLTSAAGFVFRRLAGGGDTKNTVDDGRVFSRRSKTVTADSAASCSDVGLDGIEILPEYTFVQKLVEAKFPIIFITGGAGTGKSTLINWLMYQYAGKALLGAPTAIAASNIGGKTLHSLFQLPAQWIMPRAIREEPLRDDIRNAELLVIDEISMVNPNLLDGVSAFLARNRGVDKPFGGLPVVMVGDLFQLPPVVRPGLKDFFARSYAGKTRFYASRCLTETGITYYGIELTRTFRQGDQLFVDALADIREGVNIKKALDVINSGCTITQEPPHGAVWLVPRKSDAQRVNWRMMQGLEVRPYAFEGTLERDYRIMEEALPSPFALQLKVGCQVMFTAEDPEKRWKIGTVGHVEQLSPERIAVRILSSGELVEVPQTKWQNFDYKWNRSTKRIEREELGCYRQYPLILAWAMTIHKSQGKTLERVHIDLGNGAFAFGQTYVALSRCRELSGLTLSRPLVPADILVDQDSRAFNDSLADLMERLPREQLLEALRQEKEKGCGEN